MTELPPATIKSVCITGLGPLCNGTTTVSELRRPTISSVATDDWFQAEKYLGPRGHRYCTQATRYALAAAQLALDDAQLTGGDYDSQFQGVAVGTNFSSYGVAEEFNQAVEQGGADAIQPMDAPNFSINIPGSCVAIRQRFQAFSLTFTEPLVAGLQAIIVGCRAIGTGRAKMVLAAATEHGAAAEAADQLGIATMQMGACAMVLEELDSALSRGAVPYALVGDSFSAFAHGKRVWKRLSCWLGEALAKQPAEAPTRIPCSVSLAPSPEIEAGVRDVLGSFESRLSPDDTWGLRPVFLSVSPVLQLARLAAQYGQGILICGGRDGHLVGVSLQPLPAGACRIV